MPCIPSPTTCARVELPVRQKFYNCSYCMPLSRPPTCDISCSSANCCFSMKYHSCVNRCMVPPQRCSLYLRTPDMCLKPEPEICNVSCPPLGCPRGPCPGMCCDGISCDPCCISKMPCCPPTRCLPNCLTVCPSGPPRAEIKPKPPPKKICCLPSPLCCPPRSSLPFCPSPCGPPPLCVQPPNCFSSCCPGFPCLPICQPPSCLKNCTTPCGPTPCFPTNCCPTPTCSPVPPCIKPSKPPCTPVYVCIPPRCNK